MVSSSAKVPILLFFAKLLGSYFFVFFLVLFQRHVESSESNTTCRETTASKIVKAVSKVTKK